MASIRAEIRRLSRERTQILCPVRIDAVDALTEHFTRVVVHGDGLADYRTVRPADAFKLMLPPDGNGGIGFPAPDADGLPAWPDDKPRPVLRPYTVRHFDAASHRIAFDVALHGDGLATNWLAGVRAGDVVGLAGMRREFHAGTDVERHLIAGDASALPAVAVIVESLPDDVEASVVIEADSDAERALVPARPNVELTWVIGRPSTGADSALEVAVRRTWVKGVGCQLWIGAEAGVVRALRRYGLDQLGVERENLQASAYWKAGDTSDQRDAQAMERYRTATQAGLDIADPDVVATLEFD